MSRSIAPARGAAAPGRSLASAALLAAFFAIPLAAQDPARPAPSPLPIGLGPDDDVAPPRNAPAWAGRWQGRARLPDGRQEMGELHLTSGKGRLVGGALVADLDRWPVQGTILDDGGLELDVFGPAGRGRVRLRAAATAGGLRAEGDARLADVPGVVELELARTGEPPGGLTPLVRFVPPERSRPRSIDRTSLDAAGERAVEGCMQAFLAEKQPVGITIAFGRIADGAAEVTDIRGYGYADFHAGAPARAATRYRWASISKPLSACVTHRLVSAGTVDLARDVRELVPEFPEKRHPVTLRDILCHQSGVTHYNGAVVSAVAYDSAYPFVDAVVALDRFKETPLGFEPGTKTSYSTHAWTLLAATVGRAAGKPFAQLIEEQAAEPLGLETLTPDRIWEDVPDRTRGYHRCGPLMVQSVPDDISWKLAGGGLISTAGDLARFGLGIVDGRWLDADAYARLTTPQTTADGKPSSYGLGIRVGEIDGQPVLSHSGSQNETATYLIVDPDRKLAVAVMCNTFRTEVTNLGRDLLRILRSLD